MLSAIITLTLYIVVLLILWWLIDYLLKSIPVADPPARFIRIGATVVFTLIVVLLILRLLGVGDIPMPRLA
jgi:hypothetical protein